MKTPVVVDTNSLFNMKDTVLILFFLILLLCSHSPDVNLQKENERLYQVCDSLLGEIDRMQRSFDKCYTYKTNNLR